MGKVGRDAGLPRSTPFGPMPQLAYAYLALADDDHLAPQRTLPRMVAAAAASVVLAVGAPLGLLVINDNPIGPLTSSKYTLTDDE